MDPAQSPDPSLLFLALGDVFRGTGNPKHISALIEDRKSFVQNPSNRPVRSDNAVLLDVFPTCLLGPRCFEDPLPVFGMYRVYPVLR